MVDFRHKYLVVTVRTLFGLSLLTSGLLPLLMDVPTEGPQNVLDATNTLMATGLFHLIKIGEAVAGVMIVTGLLPALGAVITAPIGIGIIVFSAALGQNVIAGVAFALMNLYLGYAYWDQYRHLFARKS